MTPNKPIILSNDCHSKITHKYKRALFNSHFIQAMPATKKNNIQLDLTVLSGGNANLISHHLENQHILVTEPQLVLKGLLAWHLMNNAS